MNYEVLFFSRSHQEWKSGREEEKQVHRFILPLGVSRVFCLCLFIPVSISLSHWPLASLVRTSRSMCCRFFAGVLAWQWAVTGWGSQGVAGGGEGSQNSSLGRGRAVGKVRCTWCAYPGAHGKDVELGGVAEGLRCRQAKEAWESLPASA